MKPSYHPLKNYVFFSVQIQHVLRNQTVINPRAESSVCFLRTTQHLTAVWPSPGGLSCSEGTFLTPLCLTVLLCLTLTLTAERGSRVRRERYTEKKKRLQISSRPERMAFLMILHFLITFTFHGRYFEPCSLPWCGITAVFRGGSQGTVIKPAARHEASPQEPVISYEIRASQASTMCTIPCWPQATFSTFQNGAEIVSQFNH